MLTHFIVWQIKHSLLCLDSSLMTMAVDGDVSMMTAQLLASLQIAATKSAVDFSLRLKISHLKIISRFFILFLFLLQNA
jgi:hypothetical protein